MADCGAGSGLRSNAKNIEKAIKNSVTENLDESFTINREEDKLRTTRDNTLFNNQVASDDETGRVNENSGTDSEGSEADQGSVTNISPASPDIMAFCLESTVGLNQHCVKELVGLHKANGSTKKSKKPFNTRVSLAGLHKLNVKTESDTKPITVSLNIYIHI